MPAVGELDQRALGVAPAAEEVGQLADQDAEHRDDRHQGDREHEQHRHEHELGRDRVAGPDLELDLGGDRVGHQQCERNRDRELALTTEADDQRHGRGDKGSGDRIIDPALARR